MKNKNKQNALLIICVILIGICCSRKTIPTSEVNFLSNDEGTISIRAVGIGSNLEDAKINAEKNAFNVLFFRGLPQSEQKTALIGTNEGEEMHKHKDYFDQFYNKKRYKSFVMSTIQTSDLIKYKGGKKSISVDIKINLVALRKDLEQFNIIRKFGF